MEGVATPPPTPTPMPRPVHTAQAAEERQRANCVRVNVTVTCHSREALLIFRELPQALLRDSMERAFAQEIKRCLDTERGAWRGGPFSEVVVEERVQHQQRRLFRDAFRYKFYPDDVDVIWDRDFTDSVAVERVEVREGQGLKREHSATMLRRFVRFLLFDKRTGFTHVAKYYPGRKLPDLVADALAPLPRRLVEEALEKLGAGLLGMAEVKREFRNCLRQFEGANKLSAPRGILCYGPPGTGKTTLVAALLKLLDFVSVTDGDRIIAAGEFAQNIVGDRERMITHLADRAAAIPWQLCVLPVDEVETLCQQRGATEGGGRNNAESLSLLLAKINGGDDVANFNMMCSTNFPEQLDQALMRRIELKLFIGGPDAAIREEFLRHPTFGLPPAYLAAIGPAGVARLVVLTLNFSHDNMRKFISSLAPWVEGPERISEAQVERLLRDYCDKEGIHLGGMSVCALLSEGIHTQVIPNPPTLAQRTFTGKVFVSLAPSQSDEERVQFLYNQPRSAVLLLAELLNRAQDSRAQFSEVDAQRVQREALLSDQQLAHLLQLSQYLPNSSPLFRAWLHEVSQSDAVRPRLEVRGLKLRSKDDVIVSLLQLAVRHFNVNAMQVINASFLFRHNATSEDAAMHVVNDELRLLRSYPRSMVVFDLDSLASVTKHFMPAQAGQEGSFSYEILYKRLVQLILERFNASAEFAEEKQHIMVVMCQNPVLFTTFAEATQWPEAASAKKRRAEAEEAQKDRVCDRCWQHFTEAKNEPNSCRRHIGEPQSVTEGDRYANPPIQPVVKKLKHLEELSRLYEGSAPAGDVRWTCCSNSGLASAGEAGAPHVVFPRLALGTRPPRGAHYITNAERSVHIRTDVVGEGTEAVKWRIAATVPVGLPVASVLLPRGCCGVWLVEQSAVQWRPSMQAEAERLQRPLLLVTEERGSVAAEVFAPDAKGPTPLVLLPYLRAA